jgi:outer membrane protein assembly factor BamB
MKMTVGIQRVPPWAKVLAIVACVALAASFASCGGGGGTSTSLPSAGSSVQGTVTLAGVGLAGVTVSATPGGKSAVTGADGRYMISGLDARAYVLTPMKPGYAFTPPTRLADLASGGGMGQDFVAVPAPPRVSGRILNAQGGGFPGATVTLTPGGQTAVTLANGSYDIKDVTNGDYTVTPSLAGWTFTPASRNVTVSGLDVVVDDFIATAAGGGHSVSGSVLESGSPLAGVKVALSPGGLSATTSAAGAYTIPGVADGTYTAVPSLDAYTFAPAFLSVSVLGADVAGVNFDAIPPGGGHAVSGTVTESGVGSAGVILTLTPGGAAAITGADGKFSITGVADGSYTLTPSKSGLAFTPTSRAVSVSGADVTGQDFTAAPAQYAVSGTVTLSGSGLAGVALTLTPGGLTATTASDGTYTITGVDSGAYTLKPSLTGYSFAPALRSVDVNNADVTGQDFAATLSTFTVFGTITNKADGSGLAGALITVTPGGWSAASVTDGLYGVPGVPDGTYTLTPTKAGYSFAPPTRSVTVADADVPAMDFVGTPDGVANTPWPKFHRDAGNSGLSSYVGAQTNGVKWTNNTGRAVWTSPAIATAGDPAVPAVFVGNEAGDLYALKTTDGTKVWQFASGHMMWSSPAVSPDAVVYFGSEDENVYAVNTVDGGQRWAHATGGMVEGSPAIASDGTIYIGSEDFKLYALNPADGSEKWTYAATSSVRSAPAIGADGTVYVGSLDGGVYALNPADGGLKWFQSLGGQVRSSPSIAADGTIYIGSDSGSVYALDPADGGVKWTAAIGAFVRSSPAIGADGTVYFGAANGNVYALNPVDGGVKWTAPLGTWVDSSPAIGADGTIYIGSLNGTVCALNPADGSTKWFYATAGGVLSSPAIDSDGTVYVGSWDGNVYAFSP